MNEIKEAKTEVKLFWITVVSFGIATGIYLANNFVPFLIWLGV